jgi:hypothetical protein
MYWFNSYSKWFEGTDTQPWPPIDKPEDLRSKHLVNVLTPEAAIAAIRQRVNEVPVEMYTMMLSPPGIAMSVVAESIDLFARKVMPSFR